MGKIKTGEQRKKEILITALNLFCQKGYDKTPIQLILDTVGIGKGTFYYYFKSKEEIIDAIIEDCFFSDLDIIQKITYDTTLSALEKINQVVSYRQKKIQSTTSMRSKVTSIIFRPENLTLQHKFIQHFLAKNKDLYTHIIEQGNQEQTMQAKFPQKTSELLLLNSVHCSCKIAQLYCQNPTKNSDYYQQALQELEFLQESMEKLLGVETNALQFSLHEMESIV